MIVGLSEVLHFELEGKNERAYKVEDFDANDIKIFVGKYDGHEVYEVKDIQKYDNFKYIALFVG